MIYYFCNIAEISPFFILMGLEFSSSIITEQNLKLFLKPLHSHRCGSSLWLKYHIFLLLSERLLLDIVINNLFRFMFLRVRRQITWMLFCVFLATASIILMKWNTINYSGSDLFSSNHPLTKSTQYRIVYKWRRQEVWGGGR
jgi:hypothetical protein